MSMLTRQVRLAILVIWIWCDNISARLVVRSKQGCLEYIEYLPSEWELEWLNLASSRQNTICATIERESSHSETWLNSIADADVISRNAQTDLSHDLDFVWSFFKYRDVCSWNREEFFIPIEPAVGLLRNPFSAPCRGSSVLDVQDRNYIFIAPEPLQKFYPGRKLLFDLGTGASFLSSLTWFADSYTRKGITFDEIWAWEAQATPPHEYWQTVPEEYVSKLHFYNTYASDQLSPTAPLGILESRFKTGDFIVVKLDIDNEILENSIMRKVMTMKDKIAELFFEKHFDAPEMQPYFGKLSTTYNDTLTMFHQFRSLGIRLHYWP